MKLSVKLCAVLFAKKAFPREINFQSAVSYNPLVTSYKGQGEARSPTWGGKLIKIPKLESH